jgi:signal transduction histidine kinase
MARLRAVRPTWVESGLAVVLLCLSVVEMLFSDEQPTPDVTRVIMAVVPPVLVAFSRNSPALVAAGMTGVLMLESVQPGESGTLGTGFAWMAIAFALGAWLVRPWPWIGGMGLASVLADLRTVDRDLADLLIDLAFIGFAFAAGRVVHRRAMQASALSSRLQIADADRVSRTNEAVNRERALIARELHDIVAHSVSLMVVQAGTARPAAERVDSELAAVLQNIEQSGREALTELRRLLGVLRSDDEPDLQPVPDLSRLDELVESFRRAGLEVHATLDVPDPVSPGVALCAYRVVQEGLTNALRYSDGSPVDVSVTGDRRALTVRIQDRGGAPAAEPIGAGTGLVGLRERVLLCGGHLLSGPSGPGHLLKVTLPMTDQALLLPEAGPS